MPRFHPTTGAVDVGRVDGNAASGVLTEIFTADMTLAQVTCRFCNLTGTLAETTAEIDEASVTLICRGCSHTLLRCMTTTAGHELSFPGLAALTI